MALCLYTLYLIHPVLEGSVGLFLCSFSWFLLMIPHFHASFVILSTYCCHYCYYKPLVLLGRLFVRIPCKEGLLC